LPEDFSNLLYFCNEIEPAVTQPTVTQPKSLCSTFRVSGNLQTEQKLKNSRKDIQKKNLMGIKFIIKVAWGCRKVCVLLFGFRETATLSKN